MKFHEIAFHEISLQDFRPSIIGHLRPRNNGPVAVHADALPGLRATRPQPVGALADQAEGHARTRRL